MTNEEVIALAREAGAGEPESLYGRTDYVVMTRHDLERYTALVLEKAAKGCEEHGMSDIYKFQVANECAAAIRSMKPWS